MTEIQTVVTPSSLEEALILMNGSDCIPLAGATDIFPRLRADRLPHGRLINIYNLPELKGVHSSDGEIVIGAMTTHTEIISSQTIKNAIPALCDACSRVGSPQIRNRATIGGNICNASPAADSVPVLEAAGAYAVIKWHDGSGICSRNAPLTDVLVSPGKTSLRSNELLASIHIPIKPESTAAFEKIGGRSSLVISIVSAAMNREHGNYHVVFGSMGPTAVFSPSLDRLLSSAEEEVTLSSIRKCICADLHPISDVRASESYRLSAATGLVLSLYERLNG